ncbi:MAG TPA: hypothetical protein PLA90_03120 [Candidatus Sumerlaeota bacterium]|nr:hypothetical protein [Candidatus Sumerlaeota bacterium]HPS00509.1 hypothetical protein [Candidatus Sumerlaeota bacterium]
MSGSETGPENPKGEGFTLRAPEAVPGGTKGGDTMLIRILLGMSAVLLALGTSGCIFICDK